MNRDKLFNFLFKFKIGFAFIGLFLPFYHPHIIRQNDTLGIIVRYWLRWTQEPNLISPLYPALIQAGDSYGIHATEFPLLYIILAPLMALPNPYAIILIKIIFFAFALFLVKLSSDIWEKNKSLDLDFKLIHKIFIIFGCSSVYFFKLMPDFIAMMMVLIAVGLSFEKNALLKSTFWATLGLLLKPTVILVFPIIFLATKRRVIESIFSWMLISVFCAGLYYTMITAELNSTSDIVPYFYSSLRNPFEQLISFFYMPGEILKLLFKNIFTIYVLIFILADLKLNKVQLSALDKKVWGLLGLQVLMGASLDGEHSFVHDYYYMGTSIVVAIIFFRFMQRSFRLSKVALVILLLFNLDKGYQAIDRGINKNLIWQLAEISKQIPANEHRVRTNQTRYANFGPYLKKIENSKNARYGVYRKSDIIDDGEIIFQTKDLKLIKF